MKVLVTGAKGFLGKATVSGLKKIKEVEILICDRTTSEHELSKMLQCAEFIFHFAGEVAPSCSDESFKVGNAHFTKRICEELKSINKATPIMFASTIHALAPQNAYGFSKQMAEIELKEYAQLNQSPLIIYHLPHMFGPGCKPNYNSVITTWIHNIVNDLPINIYDKSITMEYCFSLDLVVELIQLLDVDNQVTDYSASPKVTHKITLGKLVDILKNIHKGNYDKNSDFEVKLNQTYRTFL